MADNLEQKANNNGSLAPKKSVELALAGFQVRDPDGVGIPRFLYISNILITKKG